MKVELVQIAGRDGDTAHNLERAPGGHRRLCGGHRTGGVPETHLTGFPSEDNIAAPPSRSTARRSARCSASPVNVTFGGDRHRRGGRRPLLQHHPADRSRRHRPEIPQDPPVGLRPRHLHAWRPLRHRPCGTASGSACWCFDIEFPESARPRPTGCGTDHRDQWQHGPLWPDPSHCDHGPRHGKPGLRGDGQPRRAWRRRTGSPAAARWSIPTAS